MAKKKSRYNVKNGNAYDQLLFETIMSQIIDAPIKSLERNTAYKVNDICSETTLPKGGFLICSTAGTTTDTVPTAFGTAAEGATVTDGTAKFTVRFLDQLVSSVNNNKPDDKGNVTLPTFTGASLSNNGSSGLVPAPKAGEQNKVLKADGTWEANVKTVNGQAPDGGGNVTVEIPDTIPTGTILSFAGNTIPDGYLLCDGAEINRTTYARLFSVIGTLYGEGDSSTTFNLPNLIDRFLEGGDSSTAGNYVQAGLPNITGRSDLGGIYSSKNYDGFVQTTQGSVSAATGASHYETGGNQKVKLLFDASLSSAIYGSSKTVQPPAITMQYIIKY